MKYFNFAIVASFFCLWLDSLLSNNAQIIVGFILILSFGILHGANDLLLIKKIDFNKEEMSIQKTLFYYILVVAIGSLLFSLQITNQAFTFAAFRAFGNNWLIRFFLISDQGLSPQYATESTVDTLFSDGLQLNIKNITMIERKFIFLIFFISVNFNETKLQVL